jgi:hypothetical protein
MKSILRLILLTLREKHKFSFSSFFPTSLSLYFLLTIKMSGVVVKLDKDVVPTKDTRLVLAGVVSVPPIGNKKTVFYIL